MAGAHWVIILAAGDGTRLQPLTRILYPHDCPDPRPKQFAVFSAGKSMLQHTVERMGALCPPERMVVVVARHHRALATEQLEPYRGVTLIEQPQNLGTAAGILLPLKHVIGRDPAARVTVTPSDHHVPNQDPMLRALERAARASAVPTLLGVRADRAETAYGWIVRDGSKIKRFVEKPQKALAEQLFANGALWNTFVMTGAGAQFWRLTTQHLPELAGHFCHPDTAEIYRRIRPADFSRDVLQKASGLEVQEVAGSGWCDWGTPERLLSSLDGTPHFEPLLRRIIAARGVARPFEPSQAGAIEALSVVG